MPNSKYPVLVRDIVVPGIEHDHRYCDDHNVPYLCPVPECWWNDEANHA